MSCTKDHRLADDRTLRRHSGGGRLVVGAAAVWRAVGCGQRLVRCVVRRLRGGLVDAGQRFEDGDQCDVVFWHHTIYDRILMIRFLDRHLREFGQMLANFFESAGFCVEYASCSRKINALASTPKNGAAVDVFLFLRLHRANARFWRENGVVAELLELWFVQDP